MTQNEIENLGLVLLGGLEKALASDVDAKIVAQAATKILVNLAVDINRIANAAWDRSK